MYNEMKDEMSLGYCTVQLYSIAVAMPMASHRSPRCKEGSSSSGESGR